VIESVALSDNPLKVRAVWADGFAAEVTVTRDIVEETDRVGVTLYQGNPDDESAIVADAMLAVDDALHRTTVGAFTFEAYANELILGNLRVRVHLDRVVVVLIDPDTGKQDHICTLERKKR
jgi:hypothetical protein